MSRVCVIGAGGQLAEGIAAWLVDRRHIVTSYRPGAVPVPGVPARPPRPKSRLEHFKVSREPLAQLDSGRARHRWVDERECARADVYVFCLPSFLAEFVGYRLGRALRDKLLVNVSNRFMGTEPLCRAAERTSAGWSMAGAIAFNSPPLLAYQRVRNDATSLLYSKPFVLAAPCRGTSVSTAANVISDLFGIREIRWMSSELELAFENINSVVHAVQDLACLRAGLFNFPGALYEPATYTDEMVARINAVTADRDAVASRVTTQRYRNLADFDATTFAAPHIPFPPGSASYRHVHPLLSKVPRPTALTAHGYEDVGWSMVPMEAMGHMHDLSTPALSRLIDEWNRTTGVDYRSCGRAPVVSLGAAPSRANWP